jgi:fructokinase
MSPEGRDLPNIFTASDLWRVAAERKATRQNKPFSNINVVALGEVELFKSEIGDDISGNAVLFGAFIQALGAHANIHSRLGSDDAGEWLRTKLKNEGLNTDFIQKDADKRTTIVELALREDGAPALVWKVGEAWKNLGLDRALCDSVFTADAVYIDDTIGRAGRPCDELRRFLRTIPPSVIRVMTAKKNKPFATEVSAAEALTLCDHVVLNEEEFAVLRQVLQLRSGERDQLAYLAERFKLESIAIRKTQAFSVFADEALYQYSGSASKVVDTIGAEEGFAAGLVVGLLSGSSIEVAGRIASEVASAVISASSLSERKDTLQRLRFTIAEEVR